MPRHQCFPDMTGLMHIRTQSNYGIMHRTCTGSSPRNPNSGKREVTGTRFHFLARNSSPLIVSGRGKSQFFQRIILVYQQQTKAGLIPRNGCPTQNGRHVSSFMLFPLLLTINYFSHNKFLKWFQLSLLFPGLQPPLSSASIPFMSLARK